jgi:lipoprotein-anchoring transpeptidase ErfK/SrfK
MTASSSGRSADRSQLVGCAVRLEASIRPRVRDDAGVSFRSAPWRGLAPVLAALAVIATACGGSAPVERAVATSPVVTPVTSRSASPTPKPGRHPRAGVDAVPRKRYLSMWNRPGSGPPDFAFDARSPNGGRAPMLVKGTRTIGGTAWVRILLPIRPNGASAWAHADDVRLVGRREEIVVDLSARVLRRYDDGKLVDRFRVGIGTPATPTATGTFYVWQRVHFSNAYGPYGIFALGLSGFSPVLSDWPGGGRMAIHGTANPSDRGQAVSHGCVRVYNADLKRLLDVRLGTPVVIER